jgi:Ig-like domain from next to BRCA1 gene
MSSPDFVFLPSNVLPGQTVDLSMNLIAPEVAGKYQGNWQFEAPSGKVFGVGDAADQPIWLRIRVITPSINTSTMTPMPSSVATSTETAIPQNSVTYDFVSNACSAQWENGHEFLPCPGLDGDKNGFVLVLNQAQLEDDTVMNLATLLTFPELTTGGSVQGIYPDYLIQLGDHLQTSASCEYGAKACSVLFQISYIDSSRSKNDLWTIGEFYDGKYSNADIDLSRLAGMRVKFVLSVSALGSPVDDRALWIAPHIVHSPVATPTVTGMTTTTYASPLPTTTSVATATHPSPVSTATSTYTAIPTVNPVHNVTPTPAAAAKNPAPPSSIPQILNQIISFFQRLLGH